MSERSNVVNIADRLAARPVLTAKGEAAVARALGTDGLVEPVPGHYITVTRCAVGRALFECECGLERLFPSKTAANRAALDHYDTELAAGRPARSGSAPTEDDRKDLP